MTSPTQTRILDELTLHPGQTAKQIAKSFDWPATKASRYLGMLYFINLLDREGAPHHSNEYTYSIRGKVEAPRLVPMFPARIAERV